MDDRDLLKQEAVSALGNLIQNVDKKLSGEEWANRLMEAVGSIRSIYESNREDLVSDCGATRPVAEAIDIIDDLTRCVMRDEYRKKPVIKDPKTAAGYFQALMYGRQIEYCYLMLLDARGKMIACPLMQKGTIDRSAVYVRHLALSAVRAKAKYAIVSHNHPGGNMFASQADVQVTHAAMEAFNTVGVILLDHLIVYGDRYASIRESGTPTEKIWLNQNKEDKILIKWLSKDAPKAGRR